MGLEALSVLDYVVFISTIVVSLGVGIFFGWRRKSESSVRDFFSTGQMSMLPVSISMTVSFFSSVSMLGTPAEVYFYGVSIWFLSVSRCLAGTLGYMAFGKMLYALKVRTANKVVFMRLKSRLCASLASLSQVLMLTSYNGVVIYATSILLYRILGVPSWGGMLLLSFITTVYTTLGGFKAVIWSDVVQFAVIMAGLMIILIRAIVVIGGLDNVWEICSSWGRMKPDCVFVSAITNILTEGILTFTGLAVFAFYAKEDCDLMANGLIQGPNELFAHFVQNALVYQGMVGLLVACLICGALSNLSSSVNSCALLFWEDIVNEFPKFMAVLGQRQNIALICTNVFCGVLTLLVAMLVSSLKGTIFMILFVANASALTAIAIFFYLPLTIPRVNWKSTLCGVVLGVCFVLWTSIGALTISIDPTTMPVPQGSCVNFSTNGLSHADNYTAHSVDYNASTPLYTMTASEEDHMEKYQNPLGKLYELSGISLAPIGLLIGFAAAILASILPGFHNDEDTKDVLLFSHVTWWMGNINRGQYGDIPLEERDPGIKA